MSDYFNAGYSIDSEKPLQSHNTKCPKCDNSDVVYIRYGSSRAWKNFDGGCSVGPDKPKYMCQDCNNRFGTLMTKNWECCHHNYSGLSEPKAIDCIDCWMVWLENNGYGQDIRGHHLLRILESMMNKLFCV